jgi:hypothetical protein
LFSTTDPAGSLPNFLHRWDQKPNQRANDGDDHEQFDQGKSQSASAWGRPFEEEARVGRTV